MANRGPFEDERRQRQYSTDGFDGVLPNNGYFQAASGVELEAVSSTSYDTRDRLDHRTASDVSSQGGHQAERPLISGEPLLRGIGEQPVGLPAATPVDEGRRLRRRGASAEDGVQGPMRHRSLVRPERQHAGEAPSRARAARQRRKQPAGKPRRRRCCPSPWQTYCRVVTFWAPGRVLGWCGMPDALVQMAWREKMGLVSLILLLMGAIAFLTFGFQQVLCGLSGQQTRIKWNEVGNGYVVVAGRAYDITRFGHKATPWTGPNGANIMGAPANAGGKDLSFLFQNPNAACHGVMSYSGADSNGNVVNAFPCVYYNATG
ncbi:Chitin synthase, class 3, partial [Coemansia furcata]